MRNALRGTLLALAIFGGLMPAQQVSPDVSPTKKITLPMNAVSPAIFAVASSGDQSTSGLAASAGNGIVYHGGPVILGVTNVYYVWYGNWSVDPNALPILQALAQNIG